MWPKNAQTHHKMAEKKQDLNNTTLRQQKYIWIVITVPVQTKQQVNLIN